MSPQPPLRVVVVHWNSPADCAATVTRLLDSTVAVRVTIVDNGSGAEERAELESRLAALPGAGSAEIVDAGSNLGFGPGANLGLRRFLERPGDGEWVALVPHDVEVGRETFELMLDAAGAVPTAGLCCADVGDAMVPVIDPYFGGMTVPGGNEPGWEPVDYPHGTLMMLRRGCLAEVGLFDERFFSYCEEADLALRARKAGWEVGLVRGAMVHNVTLGSSVWMVDYLQTRNTLLLVQEMSGWYHAFIRICFTMIQIVRGLRDRSTQPPVFDASARVAGVRDFMLRRFGPPPS
ncbi:MAG: glycosyltransferase [Actinomycetia bacterium]|nr:glycosyltransferase [Actinomycetes bacterium]